MTGAARILQDKLPNLGLDAVLFNSSEFLWSPNLRYITGFTGSDAAVLLTAEAAHVFTDGRYKTQVMEQCPGFVTHVVRRKVDAIARTIKKSRVVRLGVESSRISYEFGAVLSVKVPETRLVPLKRSFLDAFRIQKSPEERAKIKEAARIASESCKTLLGNGLKGRKEVSVAAELEGLFRQRGAQGIAFDTIAASGPRSALPHGKASNRVIRPGDLVVLDFGCKYEDYFSDETVTCVVGPPDSDHKRMHRAVYEAHMRALDAVKPGVTARDLDAAARRSIEAAGYGKYFIHSLGHGVGLEIHEPPFLTSRNGARIDDGMVFTIEPGVYIEALGGVRLESLICMDGTHPEVVSLMTKELIRVD
ncbi:MAG: aminopeptidase P family protein [Pseudomonadota bacterium]